MSLNFKNIRWKNFLSTGNNFTEIKLDRNKTTLIVGNNGAGKSTLLDALSFVLYGKPFRKVNKPQLLNSINSKNLIVEVEFFSGKKQYKIVRGMKPNLFEIYQDNNLIDQNSDMKGYQDMLEKQILKLSHKSFSQIVILGSASFTPFMQLSAMNRREVIEDLLDIQIFSTMNILLKERVQDNKDSVSYIVKEIAVQEKEIELHKEHLQEIHQDNDKKIKEYDAQLKALNDKLNDYSLQYEAVMEIIDNLKDNIIDESNVNKRLNKMLDMEKQIETKIKKVQKDIKFYRGHNTCPTCEQILDETFKAQRLDEDENKLTELTNGITLLQEQIKEQDGRLDQILEITNDIHNKSEEARTFTTEINYIKRDIKLISDLIDQLNGKIDRVEDNTNKIKETQARLDESIREKNKLLKHKEVLDSASVLLKDSGIKTKIIKQYIPKMNKLINKYLASMDFFVNFELDENFNETIKSRHRDVFTYDSFSEGEKLRIDLALLFTWRAIAKMRNSASTNLLIMDEIFDSSLDASGTDEFLKIIETLAKDTNIFIISHKGDALYEKFHSVVKFEKHNNFSRIAA
jgi:DNA repair exonuclease SbcCD ATPase subunit